MKKALLIGINYTSLPNVSLSGCINDTINMRNMLVDAYGFELSNIIHLRDDNNDKTIQPTRENIINSLKSLALQSANIEELWIHYSGHGSQIRDTNGDEDDKLDEILIPVDYQTKGIITDDDLLSIIRTIKCRTILLFDSCHSGTVCDLPWLFEYKSTNSYMRTQPNKTAISNPNIFMFSGCKDTQSSFDTYSIESKQAVGAFTYIFIDCLRKANHNKEIMLLYRDICIILSQRVNSQYPLLSCSSDTPKYTFTRTVANPNSGITTSTSTKTIIQTTMKSLMYQ
uniref:Peptidase C14 caspase domain-containing protein n=1 Tax=viral metagenome TaxID=1070528 RepID=A0A6C0DLH4_9ZZZZ